MARSSALVEPGEAADELHREAIARFGQSRMSAHLARARLTYGEWLHQPNRRIDAPQQLRLAHDMLAKMGAAGFAEPRSALTVGHRS